LLSVSLVKRNSIEQLPRGHPFLPIVQDHISSSVSIRQNHGGVVGTDTVARVAIDACALSLYFASLYFYLSAVDVFDITVIPEEVSDVFFRVTVHKCYLYVPIF